MLSRLPLTLILLVLAPFALAACGGDDGSDSGGSSGGGSPYGGGTGGGSGGQAVGISADPGGSLAFEETSLEAPAGPATFEFDNPASLPHDFCLEREGEEIGCTEVISSASATLDTELESGEYTYYCSVAGHREGGMEGTLKVQ